MENKPRKASRVAANQTSAKRRGGCLRLRQLWLCQQANAAGYLEVTVVRAGQPGPWGHGTGRGGESSERGTVLAALRRWIMRHAPVRTMQACTRTMTARRGRSICFCLCGALQPCWLEALELVLQAKWHDR